MIEISRLQALKEGLPYYFTGKRCPRGHVSRRRTSNYNCLECELAVNRERASYVLDWQRTNRDKIAKNTAKYRSSNREKVRSYNRQWIRDNPDKANAATAARRARIKGATPPWADLSAIKAFYRHAARLTRITGDFYEVDHIVPIAGRNVCGLHVHWNLRVVKRSVNRQKSNRLL